MKICFINIYQQNVQRGAEVYVSELSKRLRSKHDVHVLSSRIKIPGRVPFLWRFFIDPQGIVILLFTLSLIPKMLKEKYDLIIPTNSGWQVILIKALCLLTKSRMVISGQSGIGWDDRVNLFSFPDAFVALTSVQKNWARNVNPHIHVTIIPNGVDTNLFQSQGKTKKINLPSPIILCVSALVPSKQIDKTIKAVAHLKSVSLLVVGKGSERRKLNNLGKQLLPGRFKIISVPHQDMPSIYRSADVFTLASQESESFGIVYIEALASGLPIVATDDSKRREILGDNAFYIEPSDTEAYARSLELALKSRPPSRDTISKYSWDTISNSYESLFETL